MSTNISPALLNAIERVIEMVEFEDEQSVSAEDANGGVVVLGPELSGALSHLANLYWNENDDDEWFELVQPE